MPVSKSSITLSILFTFVVLLLATPVEAPASQLGAVQNGRPLGIGSFFGRWPDGEIPWVYNSTGAPAVFSDDAYFVSLLDRTFAEIEDASGLRFVYMGVDDTAGTTDFSDGVVAIGWGGVSAAGAAGPASSCSGQDIIDIGYCNYVDGSFRLNNNGSVTWDTGDTEKTENQIIGIMMHEALHLAGIGHSEEQISIMFADPYSNLNHLRDDDIEILVGLYGPPDSSFDMTDYQYNPPTDPGIGVDDFGVSTDLDAFTDTTMLDDADTSSFVGVFVDPAGGATDFRVFAEDPEGFYYNLRSHTFGQFGSWVSLITTDVIKTFPGTWRFHILDTNGDLVATDTLMVITSPTNNDAPMSTLTTSDPYGVAPLDMDMTLEILGDTEGDLVDASWHIPNLGWITVGPAGSNCDPCDEAFTAGSNSKSITYSDLGEYEVYVAVNDDWTRYGVPGSGAEAGPGYRTLYRKVIRVANTTDDVATFADVSGDSTPDLASFADDISGAPRVQVFSGANGNQIDTLTFLNSAWRGIALDGIADSNSDGTADDPGVAVLLREQATGKLLVHSRNVGTGATIEKTNFLLPNWTPIDVVVIDDVNGDGDTSDAAVGVLAFDSATGKTLMQVRTLSTGAKIATISFVNSAYTPIAAAVTLRAGLTPLIGVLSEENATGKILVQSRQLSDRALQRNTKFLNFDWRGKDLVSVADGNNDGTADDPAWVVLGENQNSGVNLAQARLVTSGARMQDVSIISSSWKASRLASAPDISGNGREELGAFARNRDTSKRLIQVRDYSAGTVTENISP